MAHALGVTVEGELGCLGSLETMQGDKEDGHGTEGTMTREQLLTDPEQAADFVKKTAARRAGDRHRHQPRRLQVHAQADRRHPRHRPHQGNPPPHSEHAPGDARLVVACRRNCSQTFATYGGDMKETYGVPVEEIQEAHQARRAQDQHRHRHPPGDDRRRSASSCPRKPGKFDPRDYLKPAREAAKADLQAALHAVRLRGPGVEDQAGRRRRRSANRKYAQASWRRSCTEVRRRAPTAGLLENSLRDATFSHALNPPARLQSSIQSLPLLARGKVRDNYAVGDDRILMVASDRLSAFDVIMGEPIPGKGEILTQMALFWFDTLGAVVPEPPDRRFARERGARPTRRAGARPLDAGEAAEADAGRGGGARLPRRQRLEGVPGEPAPSAACRCRRACATRASCREPIFTPAAKAAGRRARREHQLRAGGRDRRRRRWPQQIRDISIALYETAAEYRAGQGHDHCRHQVRVRPRRRTARWC